MLLVKKANLFAEVRPSVFAVAAFTKGSDLPFVAVANKIHAEPDDEWLQSGPSRHPTKILRCPDRGLSSDLAA